MGAFKSDVHIDPATGKYANADGTAANLGTSNFLVDNPFISAGRKGFDISHPERAYDQMATGLKKTAADAQALADLQWQRQMQGLAQALGYVNHSQGAYDRVYNSPLPAPGATLPQGLMAQLPQNRPPQAPPQGPMQSGPMNQQQAPGLAGYFGRGR